MKKPNVVPCNGANVDFLTLDLDDDWLDENKIGWVVCTFTNDHVTEKRQKKTTVTKTTTVTKIGEDGETVALETSSTETSETFEDIADDAQVDEMTTTEKNVEKDEETNTTTTIETVTSVSAVMTSESGSRANSTIYTRGDPVKIPNDCVQHAGRLSVFLTGYDKDGEDRTVVLTTAVPDSYWELVENGDAAEVMPEEQQQTLYTEAMAMLYELESMAESGEFDGYTPQRGVDYWTPDDVADIQEYIDGKIGDTEAALDAIISIQNSLIGGAGT